MAELDGSTTLEVLCDEIAQLALWGVQAGLSFYRLILVSSMDELHDEALEPDARVHDHAHFFIFTHEYAALGLLGGIASMDANT